MLLLYISNIITNFKKSRINLKYLDIIIVKNNQDIINLFFKAFIVRYKFYLNY